MTFLNCSDPLDLKDNATEQQEKGYGCTKVCTGELPSSCNATANISNNVIIL